MWPLEGEESAFGPLLPEHWSEFFVGIALFLVIWFVVAKFVAPMFEATYAKRADEIAGGIERAEKAQEQAAIALREYQEQLASARQEAAAIREEAKSQAADVAAEIKQQAQADADRLVASAKAQIEAERAQVVRALRGEIGGLATQLAGKIVGESLEDDERARRSVERFLDELESSQAAAK
ncbi:MAG: F0F1 ATP synthase subunit B [Propionibacteriaceae bacterium]|jgi:F-type H+-transporting ATPase subunit b|nr:F0F1 ATP synthase subunit B [Propionibacteriaceae bacterium]